jgi:DNA invertase Pin-like site-specific DNA recombinase
MVSLAPAAQLRAAIYARSATVGQDDHEGGLGEQAAECRRLAVSLGVGIIAEYGDTGSGTSWDRPGLNAMLDAAKQRDFDILLCCDPDRLARGIAKRLVLHDALRSFDVTIRYVTVGADESVDQQRIREALERESTRVARRSRSTPAE